MSELVGVFAAAHTPVMINLADNASENVRNDVFAAYRDLGRRITEREPDVLVVISDDHLHNFFLDNFPAFCIGAAAQYPGPIEAWLKTDQATVAGDPELGAHLLFEVMERGFDPSFTMQFTLDHGYVVPLELAGIRGHHRIVPIHVNTVQPPMPSMGRCLAFGQALGAAIRSWSADVRVAVLATGGISHDVGTPRMGMLNEEFDRQFLRRLASGDTDSLVAYAAANVDQAGNGAEEVRSWLIAHGIAGGSFSTLYYRGVAEWYTGIALGEWEIQ